jgi:hypothetical protein
MAKWVDKHFPKPDPPEKKTPSSDTCPNGHPANSNGNCFHDGCPYNNSSRHK